MINNGQALMYSEIYGIINMLGRKYKEAIPKKILNIIEENKLDIYNPKYNAKVSLFKQNVRKDTAEFICMLHYNYWAADDEKKNIDKILSNNQEKRQQKINELYNTNNIFKNEKNKKDEVALVEIKEDKWYKKIFSFFVKLFKDK